MNVASRKLVSDKISYSKFSGISWKGDEGFYYSGYDKPDEKNKYSAKTEFQKIFYHQIGTEQSTDKLIFEDKSNPLLYKGVAITDDQKWLMLSLSQGTDGSELRVMNLSNPKEGFKTICPGYQNNVEFIDGVDGKFLVYTNFEAPNYKVVLIDPSKPDLDHWQLIVPESNHKLESVQFVGGKLICNYLQNASSKVDVYTLEGKMESSVPLPGIGTASGFDGERNDDHTFFTFTSYNVAPTIYRYDIRFNRIEPVLIPNVSFDPNKYVVQQMRFKSKDGTEVPMFVYHRADIDLKKGPFPVLLYGYGGFNISLTPSFSIPLNYFVEQGGVYVSVSLRGGGEFGENWHQAGMLDRKQNVFDDFIGAAEYLIEKGITSKEKLAIHGRSNGGLLVGACMTQRPDLFKVALPGVGVLDMLRYHKFTVGWGWVVEYGSSDKEQDFNYLIKYSPLHNLKPGTRYPATLITTADHDDRVVPAHSFKFAAALQEANRSANPTLIRIDKQAGHGAGKPTSKQIEEWADVLSFTMYHLGMNNSMPQR
jgi:prolyl oligopeptidase